jgi:hypothetical protein
MQPHFADEWQRLTRLYQEKSDEDLLELSADFANLTETARQVLRDELRKRRLPEPAAAQPQPPSQDRTNFHPSSPIASFPAPHPSVDPETSDDNSLPCEYTWKTLLCECRDREHAWQISEVLKQVGIENWIENPAGELDMTSPRVLVAADQLDDARAIAERPIPRDIVDASKINDQDFTPPVCPKCAASDPLLLGVEPGNTWRCDVCGAQWGDSLAPGKINAEPEKSAPTK